MDAFKPEFLYWEALDMLVSGSVPPFATLCAWFCDERQVSDKRCSAAEETCAGRACAVRRARERGAIDGERDSML